MNKLKTFSRFKNWRFNYNMTVCPCCLDLLSVLSVPLLKRLLRFNLLQIFINTRRDGAEMTGTGSFWWCSMPGQEAMGTNQSTGSFMNFRKHLFIVRMIEHCGWLPMEVVESLRRSLKASWCGPGQAALVVPACAEVVPEPSNGLFQPQPCYSVA